MSTDLWVGGREMFPDHPGELDGSGVLLSSENPLVQTGKTATAERTVEPLRVLDLKLEVDIQQIKGKKKEHVDVHACG